MSPSTSQDQTLVLAGLAFLPSSDELESVEDEVHHGVSWAEFNLTEPIPPQAVYTVHSQKSVWHALVTNTWSLIQFLLTWPLTSRETPA